MMVRISKKSEKTHLLRFCLMDWIEVNSDIYHEALADLSQMGFYDVEESRNALVETGGNVKSAVKILLQNERRKPNANTPLSASTLLCEWQESPTGVTDQPMLSWLPEGNGNNKSQTAFRVVLKTRQSGIVVYDSKKQISIDNQVTAHGRLLSALIARPDSVHNSAGVCAHQARLEHGLLLDLSALG